jgi:hypothetical protein
MALKYSEYQKNLNSYIDYSVSSSKYTATSFGSIVGNWIGGVLAPNGNIYCIPSSYTSVLEINPILRTANTFGNVGIDYTLDTINFENNWYGGVLAPNGKIYGIPSSATTILEIDPMAGIVTTFGSVPSGSHKWAGGVLGYDGMIYGIPFNSTTVLQINPITRTATTFGSITSGKKWWNGVMGPNGIIYGSPLIGNTVLKIIPDLVSPSVSEINSGTVYASSGGVLGSDGNIYYMPGQSGPFIFDPRTETPLGTIDQIGGGVIRGGFGGILASNNKIYSYGASSSQLLEIDVMAQTSTLVDLTGTGSWSSNTAVLAPNGKIYMVNNATRGDNLQICTCSEIDVGCASAPADWVLSAYQNKF